MYSIEKLEQIQMTCQDFGLDVLKKTLESARKFAEQNQYLDLAVLGQFKAGKSSFLNAFLGRDLLPVGNIPVTSAITRVCFGPEEKAVATFLDGREQSISVAEVKDYVSETENPGNMKNVSMVDIMSPLLERIKGIRLVDTPGIGSIWKQNTETSIGWFPETGGALFVISAERPISETELSLLKDIYSYTPEITVLITKADLFPKGQVDEIIGFTAEAIKREFGGELPVMRYSAHGDTAEYNRAVEEKVILPMERGREKIYREVLDHKISSLAKQCLSYLNIAYQASLKEESEKARLREAVLDEHLNSHFIRRELTLIIGSYKENSRDSIQAYLNRYKEDLIKSVSEKYAAAFPGWRGNLYRVTRQFERWLGNELHFEFKELLLEESESYELLNNVVKHLTFYLKSFRERLSDNLERALGVPMKPEEFTFSLGEMKRPDISVGRSFDFHLDLLWIFFPMFLFKNVFYRFFLRKIPYEIDKNLHRLTSGMNEKVCREMDHLMAQALAYMNQEMKTVEALLSGDGKRSEYILERMDKIRY
ncbi:MAG TPA: dynamin family protein [Bacillota bacterium]|nr:dynamin family protein [Bacillota bacterium]